MKTNMLEIQTQHNDHEGKPSKRERRNYIMKQIEAAVTNNELLVMADEEIKDETLYLNFIETLMSTLS